MIKWRKGYFDEKVRRPVIGFLDMHIPEIVETFDICGHPLYVRGPVSDEMRDAIARSEQLIRQSFGVAS